MHTKNNILIIKHGSIGDFVMALGAIKSIRNHYQDSRLVLLTTPLIKNLFCKIPDIDDFFLDNRKSLIDIFNFIKLIKNNRFDCIIDLQNSKRTQLYHLLTRVISPKSKINSSKKFAQLRYLIPNHGSEHVSVGLNNQIKILGINKFSNPSLFWLIDKEFKIPTKKKFIVLIPGTSISGSRKQWSYKNFAQLSIFFNEMNFDTFVTGASSDLEHVNKIVKESENTAIDATSFSDFPKFLKLCTNASLIISVDTGPAHIAALTNAKMIWLVAEGPYAKVNKPISNKVFVIIDKSVLNINLDKVKKLSLELLN